MSYFMRSPKSSYTYTDVADGEIAVFQPFNVLPQGDFNLTGKRQDCINKHNRNSSSLNKFRQLEND